MRKKENHNLVYFDVAGDASGRFDICTRNVIHASKLTYKWGLSDRISKFINHIPSAQAMQEKKPWDEIM